MRVDIGLSLGLATSFIISWREEREMKNFEVSEKVLGRGSFSNVYLGKHISSDELVAVKVIDLNQLSTEQKVRDYSL